MRPTSRAQTGSWAGAAGPQVGADTQQQIEALEAALDEAASSFYDGILDLNTPRLGLAQAWKSISATRDKLLSLYGVPLEPLPGQQGGVVITPPGLVSAGGSWPGKGVSFWPQDAAAATAPAASQVSDWKSKLMQVVAKRAGRPLTKGEIVYSVFNSAGGFVASCAASGLLEGSYSSEEAASSKRGAEHAAARAAIQAEFPKEDPEAMVAMGKGGQLDQWGKGAAAGGAVFNKGTKRPLGAATMQPAEMDAKTRLMQSMQLLLGRPVHKGDIVFEVNALEPGSPMTQYAAVVTLPEYDANAAWEGDADWSKKGAEMSAAMKVLDNLEGAIANAQEEHRNKKAKVNREKRQPQVAKTPASEGPLLTSSTQDEFVAAGYGQEDVHGAYV